MFGGVNLLSSSARFAGPRAPVPMEGAVHMTHRQEITGYGVLSHLWLWGMEGLGTGPRGGSVRPFSATQVPWAAFLRLLSPGQQSGRWTREAFSPPNKKHRGTAERERSTEPEQH